MNRLRREMIVVVFTEGSYRGNFIADITQRAAEKLLIPDSR